MIGRPLRGMIGRGMIGRPLRGMIGRIRLVGVNPGCEDAFNSVCQQAPDEHEEDKRSQRHQDDLVVTPLPHTGKALTTGLTWG